MRSDGRSLRGAPRAEPGVPLKSTRTIGGRRGPPLTFPKDPEPYRSEAYLAFVRTKPCIFFSSSRPCLGPTEAHHHGKHPFGEKTDDTRCVPLCNRHHREITDAGYPIVHGTLDHASAPTDLFMSVTPTADGFRAATKAALDGAIVELLVEWTRDRGER